MEEKNNIINFPKEKLLSPENVQTQEDILKQIEEYKKGFADDISDFLSNLVFGELARSGVNFESDIDDYFPLMLLVTESIRALHLKASGVHHPLQDFALDAYNEENNNETPDMEENEDSE